MKRAFRLTLLFVAAAAPIAALAAERLNVLFIMTDDLNNNMGAYGHPLVQTPHMDRLASEGLVFVKAYCNYPQCGPSRASFMTGLYPEQSGVTRLRRMFRDYVPDVVTLSQHFMNNGYTAARVGKIYHYDNPDGIGTHGHDDKHSWTERINPVGRDFHEEHLVTAISDKPIGGTLSWMVAEGTDEEQTDGKVATESIKLLEKYAASGEPFFLGVGFFKPHTPFVAPKKYFDLYDPADIEIPRVPTGYFDTLPYPAMRTLKVRRDQVDLPEETKRTAIHAYYATISFLDAQVGRVLNVLEELGLADNTIVLFSSDHGYHMGEHEHFQKTTLFEQSARVPLILSLPGMTTRGQRTSSIVEMIDFYRTLGDLAGLPEPPPYVQGVSFAPVLKDPAYQPRESALMYLWGGYTLRTNRYRYTWWPQAEGLKAELYDHLNDPGEMVNLAGDANYADVQQSLHALWEERVEGASVTPTGLSFTPPEPDDNGISTKDAIRLFNEGKM
ncbi:MAG: sulfatase [Puniceicoccaceae bacterium]